MMIVGDRRDDLRAALDFLAAEGMDLVITSGGLGPTADDLTAEVVADFAGLRDGARRGAGGAHRGDPRAAAVALARRDRRGRRCAPATASRRWCPRAPTVLEPVGTAPGLVVPGAPVVVVLPGPPGELQTDVGGGARGRAGARGARRRRHARAADHAAVRAAGVRDRPDPATRRGVRRAAGAPGDHHLPAAGRDRDRDGVRPRGRRGLRGLRGGRSPRSTASGCSPGTARRSTTS